LDRAAGGRPPEEARDEVDRRSVAPDDVTADVDVVVVAENCDNRQLLKPFELLLLLLLDVAAEGTASAHNVQ